MMRLASIWIVLLALGTAYGQSKTEVRKIGVSLAVDQVKLTNDIEIRVVDHWAKNQGHKQVTCELWYVHKADMHKVQSIKLNLTDGEYTKRLTLSEFTHGTVAKIVYKPSWLLHEVVAWTPMYYH